MTHKEYMSNFKRCELCGSPRNLELHHIIPTAFGGPDIVDNWIAICSGCHGKLTPRGILIKRGMRGENDPNNVFLSNIKDAIDGDSPINLTGEEVLDLYFEVYSNKEHPVHAFFTNIF